MANYFFASHLSLSLLLRISWQLFKRFVSLKEVERSISRVCSQLAVCQVVTQLSWRVSQLAIGIKYGPLHDLFVLALVFAAIVIYDAMNIRYQSGLHAHALNKLKGEKQLNESLGHLPSETLVGSMIGVFVAAALMQI
jgi:hypothetical protein